MSSVEDRVSALEEAVAQLRHDLAETVELLRAHPSKGKRVARPLPPEWEPAPDLAEKLRARGLRVEDIRLEAEKMRAWAVAKGERKLDWDAAFWGWLLRAAKPDPDALRVPVVQTPAKPIRFTVDGEVWEKGADGLRLVDSERL